MINALHHYARLQKRGWAMDQWLRNRHIHASATQLYGPVVDSWGGPQAGEPGAIYDKVLKDVDSGTFPMVNY